MTKEYKVSDEYWKVIEPAVTLRRFGSKHYLTCAVCDAVIADFWRLMSETLGFKLGTQKVGNALEHTFTAESNDTDLGKSPRTKEEQFTNEPSGNSDLA